MAIKNYIKRVLPRSLARILTAISRDSSSPYSRKIDIFTPNSLSDFFVWSPFTKSTYFVAENIHALLQGVKVDVTHSFKFFSESGELIHEEKHDSNDFFCRVKLTGIVNSTGYTSFIHFVTHQGREEDSLMSIIKGNGRTVCEQNRGYCIYYPNIEFPLGAMVHGNFGGISNEASSYAKQRAWHLYTTAYKFELNNEYDLVLNNPTSQELCVNVVLNQCKVVHSLTIKPLGTKHIRIFNYCGSMTFESRLPICRPVIFKNPRCINTSDFDVLHA